MPANEVRKEGMEPLTVENSNITIQGRREGARSEEKSLKVTKIPINWHSGLPIYACEPYLRAVGDDYGWIGGSDEGGTLRCILPYTIIRKAFVCIVRFRVETIPIGDGLDIAEEKHFLNQAVYYFRSIGSDMIIPASTNAIFRTYPDGAFAAPYGTYIIDLKQSEDVLWKNVHPKNRTSVRGAKKAGVDIRNGLEYLDASYNLVRDTFERSEMKFMDHGAYRRMITSIAKNIKIFVAIYQGVVQGCAVIPYSGYSAYSVYAGSIPNPVKGATKLMHWDAIRMFKDMGVERYDFVGARINPEKGSKQENLMLYKQQLGGRLVQGYMWKYSIRPLKYAIYASAVRLLRGGDIVDHERHKLHE